MGKLKTHLFNAVLCAFLATFAASCSGGKGGGGQVRGIDIPSNKPVVKALISAREVDVTSDDNSLLPDRLGLQDVVYVITNPRGGSRKGWVKISRSPSDTEGFGWVETKNIRILTNYTQAGPGVPSSGDGFADTPVEEPIFDDAAPPAAADDFSDTPAPGGDDLFDPAGDDASFDDFSDDAGGGDSKLNDAGGSSSTGEGDLFSEDDLFGDE